MRLGRQSNQQQLRAAQRGKREWPGRFDLNRVVATHVMCVSLDVPVRHKDERSPVVRGKAIGCPGGQAQTGELRSPFCETAQAHQINARLHRPPAKTGRLDQDRVGVARLGIAQRRAYYLVPHGLVAIKRAQAAVSALNK